MSSRAGRLSRTRGPGRGGRGGRGGSNRMGSNTRGRGPASRGPASRGPVRRGSGSSVRRPRGGRSSLMGGRSGRSSRRTRPGMVGNRGRARGGRGGFRGGSGGAGMLGGVMYKQKEGLFGQGSRMPEDTIDVYMRGGPYANTPGGTPIVQGGRPALQDKLIRGSRIIEY